MSWVEEAACRGADPELFFPEKDSKERPEVRAALSFCFICPVAMQCFQEVLHLHPRDDYGIRAGMTVRERRALRRRIEAQRA